MNFKLTALLLIIGMLVIASEAGRGNGPYDAHHDYYPIRYDGDEDLVAIIADVLNKLDANHGTEE